MLGVVSALARSSGVGAGLLGEAVDYVAAARSALAGAGFLQVDGEPLASQPPLYPLLLCVADLGGFDPLAIVKWVNLGIFGLTIFAVGSYLRRHLESRSLVIWGCLAVALSTPLADLASRGSAEPLFILLTTLALMQANDMLADDRMSAVGWGGVFAGLAWLTSYVGAAVVAAIGLLLLFQRGVPWPRRVGRITLYSVNAALPMGLWLLRNQLLIGAWADLPRRVEHDAWAVLATIGNAVGDWLDFDLPLVAWPDSVALTVVATVVLLGLVGFTVYRAWRLRRPPANWRPVWSFCSFGLVYSALLIASAGWWYSPFGDHAKTVAPLYIPLPIAAAFALDKLLGLERKTRLLGSVPRLPPVRRGLSTAPAASPEAPAPRPGVLPWALTVMLGLWVAGQIVPNAQAIARERTIGWRWAKSETLQYIRDNPMKQTVYSNHIGAVYLNNARQAAYTRLAVRPTPSREHELGSNWQLAEAPDRAHVVWFHDHNQYPLALPHLRATPGLAPLVNLTDGIILTVDRSHKNPSNPFRETLARIRAGHLGEPAVRAVFDIYRDGRTLIYVKNPCAIDDIVAAFFLHFTLTDKRVGDANFYFHESGAMLNGDTCVVTARLLNQPIEHIRTGQMLAREPWDAEPDAKGLEVVRYAALSAQTLEDLDPIGEATSLPHAANGSRYNLNGPMLSLADEDGVAIDYDTDDDGLIEISTLAQLNAVRWDPRGAGAPSSGNEASYRAAFADQAAGMGCPFGDGAAVCFGYELTADLDFDTDGDGATWSGSPPAGDSGDAYYNGNSGWAPIGGIEPFVAVFDGNGHVVHNLYIRASGRSTGLFKTLGAGAVVSRLGLENALVIASGNNAGLLAGNAAPGVRVAAVWATGTVNGRSRVGGLLGMAASGSTIVASYSTATVRVRSASGLGAGLAGRFSRAAVIEASYATGAVIGPVGATLAGVANGAGLVTSSYWRSANIDDATTPEGRTAAQLQAPTSASGIYAGWDTLDIDGDGEASESPWDFGTSSDYPALAVGANHAGGLAAQRGAAR